jgi:carbamoyltransferase
MPPLPQQFDHQTPIVNAWLKILQQRFPDHQPTFSSHYDALKGKTISTLELDTFSKDLAASAQKALETVILHVVKNLVTETGCRDLAYAGGVALNCTTNGRLLAENYVDHLYVQPAANDAGASLGAALHVALQKTPQHFPAMDHCYYGPAFTDQEIESELKRLKIAYTKPASITKKTAQALSQGKVIAWFQGRAEVGPRALGNRSILANPAIKEMHHLLNVIKSREQWRPLAPSVLEEDIEQLFDKACPSPFMLLTHTVKPEWQEKIPAIVHVDGTTRYQSVSRQSNPKYHELITEFKKLTGLPIVMNTSFNTGGEPIVTTPEQAIKTFFTSEMDYLVLGNFWVAKS